ncbi:MAG: Phosphoesterase RecJ domain protein [Candidatus Roizmanbacteria bacterium GW2011_GWA2_37_7]|uniref:Phosphoesterase RecJ domain protein n=1 Tax=Candidatus Roizmanbacteria bacterium GW2011_GWA2_37_7 TaxID=1618481 RepID=A0A0G0H5D7_9BACT|nr:MAG: Phosphoesterase RecJ domain protein [Candidatus Roizmanbacteria bacterium GW2011_GWA2_37_7]
MMPQVHQPQDADKTIQQIKEHITKHGSGIVVLPAKATQDAIAAGTSLYMALTKLGKNVSLVASSSVQSDLIGADKIKTDLQTGGDNLVVSFPYQEGAIDKVDYNIQGERFNLVVVPREGHSRLQPDDVQFSYTGGKIDFIITVDAPNLNALGEIYQKNQRQFDGTTIINIDRHLINNAYGMINLILKSSSSTSELVLHVLEGLKVEIDKNIATNLYAGVATATNNFTAYSVNADTFEAVATLLRAGAVKKQMNVGTQFGQRPSYGNQFGAAPQMYQPQMQNQPQIFDQQDQFQQPQQGSFPSPTVSQQMPQQQSFEQQSKAVISIEQTPNNAEGKTNIKETPENFLKPKIFSGGGGLV